MSIYKAGMPDDVLDWFSGGEETQATSEADPETEPSIMTSAIKSAIAAATSPAASAGWRLMPKLVQALGVTEEQSKGGLGAIFMAARAALAPED